MTQQPSDQISVALARDAETVCRLGQLTTMIQQHAAPPMHIRAVHALWRKLWHIEQILEWQARTIRLGDPRRTEKAMRTIAGVGIQQSRIRQKLNRAVLLAKKAFPKQRSSSSRCFDLPDYTPNSMDPAAIAHWHEQILLFLTASPQRPYVKQYYTPR
jgi:hypothetical protein